jgi:catechol 2,3-dioxygenase-like lactoylglutathione lyase family enzyme
MGFDPVASPRSKGHPFRDAKVDGSPSEGTAAQDRRESAAGSVRSMMDREERVGGFSSSSPRLRAPSPDLVGRALKIETLSLWRSGDVSTGPLSLPIGETMPGRLQWPCWIGVVTENLAEQRRFYREVLGFAELKVGVNWVQFDLGHGNLLELLQRSDDPQYDRVRYQVGYAVDDIESIRSDLIARGVQPISEMEGSREDGGRWCYFRDPEGNVFEIKERQPG